MVPDSLPASSWQSAPDSGFDPSEPSWRDDPEVRAMARRDHEPDAAAGSTSMRQTAVLVAGVRATVPLSRSDALVAGFVVLDADTSSDLVLQSHAAPVDRSDDAVADWLRNLSRDRWTRQDSSQAKTVQDLSRVRTLQTPDSASDTPIKRASVIIAPAPPLLIREGVGPSSAPAGPSAFPALAPTGQEPTILAASNVPASTVTPATVFMPPPSHGELSARSTSETQIETSHAGISAPMSTPSVFAAPVVGVPEYSSILNRQQEESRTTPAQHGAIAIPAPPTFAVPEVSRTDAISLQEHDQSIPTQNVDASRKTPAAAPLRFSALIRQAQAEREAILLPSHSPSAPLPTIAAPPLSAGLKPTTLISSIPTPSAFLPQVPALPFPSKPPVTPAPPISTYSNVVGPSISEPAVPVSDRPAEWEPPLSNSLGLSSPSPERLQVSSPGQPRQQLAPAPKPPQIAFPLLGPPRIKPEPTNSDSFPIGLPSDPAPAVILSPSARQAALSPSAPESSTVESRVPHPDGMHPPGIAPIPQVLNHPKSPPVLSTTTQPIPTSPQPGLSGGVDASGSALYVGWRAEVGETVSNSFRLSQQTYDAVTAALPPPLAPRIEATPMPAWAEPLPAIASDAPTVVAAVALQKEFRNNKKIVRALDNVSLSIAAGEFVVINGPSGSGKTTLLNCLAGFDNADSGQIVVDGYDVALLSDGERTRHRSSAMGFVFQSYNLLGVLSAVENVEVPLLLNGWSVGEARDEALAALTLVGLTNRADHLPDDLSGGEQQRVTIARALVGEPKLLWADEPTGNLDPESTASIMQLLRELNGDGLTIVMVTHDRAIASLAHRCLELRNGQLLEAGAGVPSAPQS